MRPCHHEVMTDSLLSRLSLTKLDSVVFVADYLQLEFGAGRFSTYCWPVVKMGTHVLHFGDRGYRDSLCAFIGHDVVAGSETHDSGLVIEFALGSIAVNPLPTDLSGPEIAMLQIHEDAFQDASWMAWRPGEDVFVGPDWV